MPASRADDGVGSLDGPPGSDPGQPLPDRRLTWLALAGGVLALMATFAPWATSDAFSLNGIEGSQNGWFVILYALPALGSAFFLAGRGWPSIFVSGMAGLVIVSAALNGSTAPDLGVGWGRWVTAIGGSMLVVAATLAIRGRRATAQAAPHRTRRRWRWAGVVGVTLALFLFFALRQVLFVVENPSWPPPADAITAENAQAATEEFVADGHRPRDVGLDYAWSTAATIEPWAEGTEFFPRIFSDIEQAETSIHIIMFGWKNGDVGLAMADLLEQKLADGIEVRVLVDAYGSKPFERSEAMYRDLAAAGAEIVVNDVLPIDRDGLFPDRSFDWRQDEVGRAEHRKLYVIDGHIAWTGGAGIEDHFENGEFHDVMVRVTGDVVRQAQSVFLTSFASHGADLPSDLSAYFPSQPEPGSTPIAVVQVVPGGFASAPQSARQLIDEAENRLDLMNPYFTDKDLIERIIDAAERGVDVRIVVSETSNNDYASAAIRHRYHDLMTAGVEIWEYPNAVVHAKVIVADDWVHFGTLNLDAWGLYRDFEVAMVAQDAEAAALFEERLFEPDIARSSRGQEPTDSNDRFTNWLMDKIVYFL